MMRLDVDHRHIDQIIADLNATEKQVKRAVRRTIGRMATWLRTRAARAMSKELAMKQAAIRKRLKNVKFKMAPDGASGGIWIGLNPVDLLYVGGAQQHSTGVSVPSRGLNYPGAFMGPKPGATAAKLRGRAFRRVGRSRLPIEKVGMDIKKQGDDALSSDIMEYSKFEAQFFKTFEHELTWQTQKRR